MECARPSSHLAGDIGSEPGVNLFCELAWQNFIFGFESSAELPSGLPFCQNVTPGMHFLAVIHSIPRSSKTAFTKTGCQIICYRCDYNSQNCTVCNGRYRLIPDCLCAQKTYELKNNINCVTQCPQDTYQDDVNQHCTQCKNECETCMDGAQICSTCDKVRSLLKGNCICLSQFSVTTGECFACFDDCFTCSGPGAD